MNTKQLNVKLPENLFDAAKSYSESFGFRNIQELINESLREKVYGNFDRDFSKKEILLIDKVISKSLKNKDFVSEKELNKILLK